MQTSNDQVSAMLDAESFVSKAYADGQTSAGVQLYSIGYGHQIQLPAESYLVTATITEDTAYSMFKTDLRPLENQINSDSDYALSQSQFDALIDFGFNCGSDALSNILDTWNVTNDPQQTTARMQLYDKTRKNGVLTVSSVLVDRRQVETDMFLNGSAPADAVKKSSFTTLAIVAVTLGIVVYFFRS